MGWGTDFTADIFLSKIVFENEYQLQSKIEETESEISSVVEMLMMYACSNPKDILPEEWKDDGVSFVHAKVKELIDEYRHLIRLYTDLNHYKEDETTETNEE